MHVCPPTKYICTNHTHEKWGENFNLRNRRYGLNMSSRTSCVRHLIPKLLCWCVEAGVGGASGSSKVVL